ncbi:MAG: hypothetical protein V1489_01505 [Candidatus Liptonbacteria bacterium]
MGGRAAWPTVRLTCGKERCGAAPRGHARDGFKRFIALECGKTTGKRYL